MNKEVTLVRGKHCVTLSKEAWDILSFAFTNLVDSRDYESHPAISELKEAIELIESHGYVDPYIPGSQDRRSRTLAH